MAHFRCPSSSIVGNNTGRYTYPSGDTVQYNSTSPPSHILLNEPRLSTLHSLDNSNDDNDSSSSDESTSSSSSSTILASRTSTRPLNLSTSGNSLSTSGYDQDASRTTLPATTLASTSNNNFEDEEDRRCWICYGEDADSEGTWVSPCPCSLVAHEKCLLDWITENQKGSPRKIVHCPQCASAYSLYENANWILSFLGMVDETVHTVTPYITSLGLGLSLLVVTTTYGAFSVLLLFGTREGERLLGSPASWTWRSWVGLPSIPLALLSTRSRWADSTLPFAAFLFLRMSAASSHGNHPSSPFLSTFPFASSSSVSTLPHLQFTWPPTPLATLGILPWVRLLYNNLYYAAQSLISRQLSLKGVQRQQQQDQHRRQHSNNSRVVVIDNQTVNRIDNDPTTMIEQQPSPTERSTELDILLGRGPPSVAGLFMGTFLWPVIGSLSGLCLSQVKWIRDRLPEPFHRNIIGGCLFVVIKDVGSLIYRYQKVRQYRSRRIRNYSEIKHKE
ncbi:uncharacterized protein BX664DRAFT_327633 [Halteromyces radiatus]|uniref:uncharacterized protein n=1 Tax=Halteromyces radiatus TaxID=101107 RepID=UPI00221F5D4F|nr:uncharacterized protein BX664DRAFT_327633 [Halteromyces radiatus]KAI8092582.1 hypothetical protein BX664DRAFT_327633 [Halteromyces radiatus]